MKRTLLVYALLATATAALVAQQASPSGTYSGTATPPPDTTIVTDEPVQDSSGKPPAGITGYEQPASIPAHPAVQPAPQAPAPSAQAISKPSPAVVSPVDASMPNSADGTDSGIVIVAPDASPQPELNRREAAMSDPDGDMVHPGPLPAGELGYGATIRVRLLDRLSTANSETGEKFRTQVASDVMQNGQVLIPAGAEIDGTVVGVSYGHLAGRGTMHLRPETVILSDGSRFHIFAQLSGAPGSTVLDQRRRQRKLPASQLKKDSIEYGGAVGAGAITGAVVGGPAGALAGTLILRHWRPSRFICS